MPLRQKTNKGVIMLPVVIDPDNQRELWSLLHDGGKEEYLEHRRPAKESVSITLSYD